MGFFDFLRPKAVTISNPTVATLFAGKGGDPPRRDTEALLEAYNQIPRFRGVVNRIANSVASSNARFYRQKNGFGGAQQIQRQVQSANPWERKHIIKHLVDREGLEEIKKHPLMDFMMRPSAMFVTEERIIPYLTSRQKMMVAQAHLDMVGESFAVIDRKNGDRTPFSMKPVPPHWVNSLPSVKKKSYEIMYLGQAQDLGERPTADIPAEDVLWFKNPNPKNPYGRGTGFGHSLNDEFDIEEFSAKTAAARFYNQAIPSVIIGVDGMGKDDARRAQARFEDQYRGWRRAFRPHITGGKLSVHTLDPKFTDLQMVEQREFEARVMYQTFGLPPEIMGMITDANRSTIDKAYFFYALLLIAPRLDFWEDQINSHVSPQFDDEVLMLYDSPVPDDKELVRGHMKNHPYAFQVDELRREIGFDTLSVGNGELHPIKAGWTFAKIEEGVGNLAEPGGAGDQSNQNEEGDRDDEM